MKAKLKIKKMNTGKLENALGSTGPLHRSGYLYNCGFFSPYGGDGAAAICYYIPI